MGSFFLHDDYRLPDVASSLPFKKDSNSASSSNGIFENNPCFASIKKGLGFGDDTTNTNTTEEDIYADTRARSSPVVERLILEEIQNDIAEYATSIGISTDPESWNLEDTRKWLRWVASVYQLGDLSECLQFDGNALCNFSEREFILLTGSEDTGMKIAAQLDLWKNAIKMTPSAGFYHFQQQQLMDCKFGTSQARSDSSTPKLLAASCSWSATNTSASSVTYSTTSQYNTSNQADFYEYNQPPYQQYPQCSAATAPTCFPQEEMRCLPRPTIPLDRFGHYRAACQSESFSAAHTYQRYTNVSQPGPAFQQQQQQKAGFNIPKDTKDPSFLVNIKGFPDILNEVPKEYIDSLLGEKTYTVDAKESLKALAILSKPDDTDTLKDLPTPPTPEPAVTKRSVTEPPLQIPKTEIKQERLDEPINPTPIPEKMTKKDSSAVKPPRKKSSKHPIHLWEFLKQLLNEGKDCIRWVDQEKGVFKIYNSQQVAKYWGERKNRPAMNYDKLSRSIRQYYKKDIIKKTSQGKRLVYQFCDAYL